MKPATKVIRAGKPHAEQGSAFSSSITFAGPYHAAGDPEQIQYTYGRFHNPTWTQFEAALSELENGIALAFASGMAAVAAVLGVTLRAGDTVVMPSDCYYSSRVLAESIFGERGIHVKKVPTAGNEQAKHLQGAKLLWLETPSNPGLDVCDIAALDRAAHEHGVLVAVDNTTATVLGQQPLELGADFSIASDTKALTGHADLVLGHVAVRNPEWAEQLEKWRAQMGAIPGPMEVWLAHRSLGTLEMRLQRQCANALAIAEYLATRPEVTGLRYPGLPDDPSQEIAKKQMQFFGPVVSFVLPDRPKAELFLKASHLITEATSFGSIHTTAERRARWGGDDVPEGFIRLSAGCEDITDLIADIEQALNSL